MLISEIKPAKYNPRKIDEASFAGLKESIKKFGMPQPLVINKRTGNLVSGHQRLKAAEALGWTDVPIVEVDLSDSEEKALNVTLNNRHIGGDFTDGLQAVLDEVRESLGDEFMKSLRLDEIEVPEVEVLDSQEEESIPAPPIVPKSKLGDVWTLGAHRLMCGDSTSLEQCEKLMNGYLADLWIADPPFGVSYVDKNAAVHGGIVKNAEGKEIKSDTKSVEELCPFWRDTAVNAYAVTTMEASNYWCACQGSDKMMMMMMMDEAGWNIRHELIWVKSSFVFGRSDYHYQHEPIIYGWKKKGKHNWNGDRKQSSVFQIDRPHKSDLHPTTKPVELFSEFIKNSSKQGDKVFESFAGSGTTLMACEALNRISYSMELDPIYVDVILTRWAKHTGKDPVRDDGVLWSAFELASIQ